MKYEHKSFLGGIHRPIHSPIENAFPPLLRFQEKYINTVIQNAHPMVVEIHFLFQICMFL